MYLADYHTHTRFSPDGSATMTEMAQAALDAGMDEICFTDHVEPLVWGSEERHPPYDWSALTEDFAAAQAALGEIGKTQKDYMQVEIDNGNFAPNAASTIRKKGSSHPLVDSGTMRASINYVIEKK